MNEPTTPKEPSPVKLSLDKAEEGGSEQRFEEWQDEWTKESFRRAEHEPVTFDDNLEACWKRQDAHYQPLLANLNATILALKEQVAAKDEEIDRLKTENKELEKIREWNKDPLLGALSRENFALKNKVEELELEIQPQIESKMRAWRENESLQTQLTQLQAHNKQLLENQEKMREALEAVADEYFSSVEDDQKLARKMYRMAKEALALDQTKEKEV